MPLENSDLLADTTALREEFRALQRQHGNTSKQLRPAIVTELKSRFQAARSECERRLLADGLGTRCAENLSVV